LDITPRNHARRGTTLVEQVVLLAVLGVCSAVAVTGAARLLTTVAVHGAAREVAELFALARDRAMATGERVSVRLDGPAGRVLVHAGEDTLARLELYASQKISLTATRDSMAYLPSGLGYGAANLRVIVARGASRDTITVSRLGRVKR
jgi:Tfp pilus assembly protein FimT